MGEHEIWRRLDRELVEIFLCLSKIDLLTATAKDLPGGGPARWKRGARRPLPAPEPNAAQHRPTDSES